MSKRFLITAGVFASILFLPYWIYLPLLFVAIAILPMYWEGIILALLIGEIYGEGLSLPFISPIALIALITLIVLLPIRKRVRDYVQ